MKRCLLLGLVVACGHTAAGGDQNGPDPGAGKPSMSVTSPAFAAAAEIPKVHTCQGADVAPPLAWSGAPAGTKSYALIVDDPDAPDPAAPTKVFVHWVLSNIPATATGVPDSGGVTIGKNDFGNAKWNGPCPPIGSHRYFFKLYALDAADLGTPGQTKAELLAAIAGHVLAKGELVGTYQKTK